MVELTKLSEKQIEKAKVALNKKLNELLIGNYLFKGRKTTPTFLGMISKVDVNHFTEFGDANITISTLNGKEVTTYCCNVYDHDEHFGWFYDNFSI